VSLKLNSGPVTAQTMIENVASRKVIGRPVTLAAVAENLENQPVLGNELPEIAVIGKPALIVASRSNYSVSMARTDGPARTTHAAKKL
jgi:hypothetical protein